MEELKRQNEEMVKLAKEVATIKERSRILTEIDSANLPVGVWPLIKDIIFPPKTNTPSQYKRNMKDIIYHKTGILEEVKEEEWPEDGKWYWSIDEGGEVFQAQFNGSVMPKKRSSFGNVFRSETAAKEASEKIKTLLLPQRRI